MYIVVVSWPLYIELYVRHCLHNNNEIQAMHKTLSCPDEFIDVVEIAFNKDKANSLDIFARHLASLGGPSVDGVQKKRLLNSDTELKPPHPLKPSYSLLLRLLSITPVRCMVGTYSRIIVGYWCGYLAIQSSSSLLY